MVLHPGGKNCHCKFRVYLKYCELDPRIICYIPVRSHIHTVMAQLTAIFVGLFHDIYPTSYRSYVIPFITVSWALTVDDFSMNTSIYRLRLIPEGYSHPIRRASLGHSYGPTNNYKWNDVTPITKVIYH